jgi:hypothetical protein
LWVLTAVLVVIAIGATFAAVCRLQQRQRSASRFAADGIGERDIAAGG